MLRVGISFLSVLIFCSCKPSPPPDNSQQAALAHQRGDSLRLHVLAQSLERLLLERDSICDTAFHYETDVFSYGVYLHKHWNHKPCPAKNALTTVVNTWFGIHFISNLQTANVPRHNRVMIQVGDSVCIAEEDDGLPKFGSDWRDSDETEAKYATFESRLIYPYPSDDIGKLILEQPGKDIVVTALRDDTVVCSYTVPPEDKAAILESLYLSELIKRIFGLEQEINRLANPPDTTL